MGVIDIKTSDRNGPVVACKEVIDEDEVMIVTQNGIMIRTLVSGITTVGRNTQGVRVINLDEGDRVIDMTRVPKSEDEPLEDEGENENGKPENGDAQATVAEGEVATVDEEAQDGEELPQEPEEG